MKSALTNNTLLAVLLLSLAATPLFADEAATETPPPVAPKTATNLDNIDLNDTVEDPDYAAAGEELAKEAGSNVLREAAPLAKMTTIDGERIDLASIYGKKPVYLKFWATWCVPCRQQMPGFEATYKELGDKIQIVAVNIGYSDDEKSVRAFRDKYKLTMPIVIDDGTLTKLFHVNVTPQHVIIGKDVRFQYMGHAENDDLNAALAKVLAEEPDDATEARAVNMEQRVEVGATLPELSIALDNGQLAPLKAKPGRLLAVEFFSSWCEWYLETSRPDTSKACTRVREAIEEIATSLPDVDWLGISGGPWATAQDLADYRSNYNVTIPLALDSSGTFFRTFGVRDIPTVALIDDSARLVRIIDPDETDLPSAIRDTLAATIEKPAPTEP